jgi:hypothetical protein
MHTFNPCRRAASQSGNMARKNNPHHCSHEDFRVNWLRIRCFARSVEKRGAEADITHRAGTIETEKTTCFARAQTSLKLRKV